MSTRPATSINYTITRRQHRQHDATGVTVTDPYAMPAASCDGTDVVGDNDALLEVGETWGYTAAHTVTQAEIDANGGGDRPAREHGARLTATQTGPDTDDASVPVTEPGAEHHEGRRRRAGGTGRRRPAT